MIMGGFLRPSAAATSIRVKGEEGMGGRGGGGGPGGGGSGRGNEGDRFRAKRE